MARKVSATFVGSPPRDVVADASVYERWLADAAGDAALIADLVTGANGETPINHTGAPLGCQIRLPLAAQHIDRSLVMEGSAIAEDEFYIIAVPIFIPAGERDVFDLRVSMTTPAGAVVKAEVWDSTGAVVWGPTPAEVTEDPADEEDGEGARRVSRLQTAAWRVTIATTGLHFLFVSRPIRFGDADPDGRLHGWTMRHLGPITAVDGNGLAITGSTVVGDVYEAPSTLTPSTMVDFYDEEIVTAGPVSAWVLSQLNRKINALWEYVTGAKIPGNNAYQCSTTLDNSRASFTAEGLLDFPMAVLALGGLHADTGKPSVSDYTDLTPPDGMIDWSCHPVSRSLTNDNFANAMMVCPSFSTSSSALKCAVLIHSPSGVASGALNWRFRVNSAAGASAAVAAVQIGSSNLLLATITAIPFTASADNAFSVQIANTGAGALAGTDQIDICGVCFYFDP